MTFGPGYSMSRDTGAGSSGAGDAPETLADILSQAENANATLVMPKPWCEHLAASLSDGTWSESLSLDAPCLSCQHVGENWLCLTCRSILCSRYVQEHMLFHSVETQHLMAVSFSDLSVWCYGCEEYIDHPAFYEIKNLLHVKKFGLPMPKSTSVVLGMSSE